MGINLPNIDFVLNQRKTPTCVSHAGAMAAMLLIYNRTHKWVRLSPFALHGYFDNDGGGMHNKYIADLICKWGCLPSSIFTERGDNPEMHEALMWLYRSYPNLDEIAATFKMSDYKALSNFEEVKQAIKNGNVVLGAVRTGKNFGNSYKGIEPVYPKGTTNWHAVCFFDVVEIDGKEYLAAINSHGVECGDKGKVYIPKGRLMRELYAVELNDTNIKPKASVIEFIVGSKQFNVDGGIKDFEVSPYINGDRVFLPVRFVAENLGAEVEWDAENGVATIKSEEATIKLTVNSKVIEIDRKQQKMDVAPEIINNRMMLPIRHIAEALNCNVEWIADENKAVISAL